MRPTETASPWSWAAFTGPVAAGEHPRCANHQAHRRRMRPGRGCVPVRGTATSGRLRTAQQDPPKWTATAQLSQPESRGASLKITTGLPVASTTPSAAVRRGTRTPGRARVDQRSAHGRQDLPCTRRDRPGHQRHPGHHLRSRLTPSAGPDSGLMAWTGSPGAPAPPPAGHGQAFAAPSLITAPLGRLRLRRPPCSLRPRISPSGPDRATGMGDGIRHTADQRLDSCRRRPVQDHPVGPGAEGPGRRPVYRG